MPRACTVCIHSDVKAIDAALNAEESFRSIAKRFDVTKDSLFRHQQAHVAKPVDPLRAFLRPCPAHGDGPHHYSGDEWRCIRCSPWDGTLAYFRLPSARP